MRRRLARGSGIGFRVPGAGFRTSRFAYRASEPDTLYPLVLALALFLALSLKNIDLPGLYYDEALDVVPAMQLLLGQPVEPVRGVAVHIAGRALPLMIMDYVGTVNTYLALPVFAVLGVQALSVRLLPIMLAALTLVLAYVLALRLFDWRVAAVTALLAAVDPSYVFFSRMGIHVSSVMTVFALSSLLAYLRWQDSGRRRWLAVAGLLLGLGLWAKVLFLWWILALAAYVVVRRVGIVPAAAHRAGAVVAGRRGLLAVGLGIVAGSAPLWIYNLRSAGTLISFSRNALVTEHGVSNLNIVANLIGAVKSFVVLLDGRYFWFQGGQFANGFNVVLFAAAALACLLLARRRAQWQPGLLLVGVLITVIVALSAFTVSGIWATHLYVLLPLPQMVVGAGLTLAAQAVAGGRRWLHVALIGSVLAVGMAANYQVDATYHAALARSRGLSRFSDAIYDLSDWLDARQYAAVYAVDWGIQKNVQILTKGRVNPIEISGYSGEPPEAFVQRAEQALRAAGAVYVFHSAEDTVYELYPAFKAASERLGVKIKIIEAFRDHSGAPVHVVWEKD